MTEVQSDTSLVEELTSAVDTILSGATVADTTQMLAAARALEINPESLELDKVQAKFKAAIKPLEDALNTPIRTRDDALKIQRAVEIADQLKAISQDQDTARAPEASVDAKAIIEGVRVEKGEITVTLPLGIEVQEAGEILNAAAKAKGMPPVFYEGHREFWAENEKDSALRTEPGETYQFTIPTDSVSKDRAEQVKEYGEGAPLGAIAIAEAVERLRTNNKGTLFQDASGDKIWVRGSAPGFALCSYPFFGVFVDGPDDGYRLSSIAFAPLAASRN